VAILYVVSTPIGNLEDLSPRAQRVLGEVGRVLAEDTRHTGVLLKRLGLKKPLVSLHEHNEAGRTVRVLAWLAAGEDLALVSDAGTPLVSDPGARLVAAAAAAGHRVVPLPGPSAVLGALVGSGLPAERFAFLGFVPRKGRERAATLARIAGSRETTVVFESPERLGTLLADLVEACGAERAAAVARELTKVYESFVRGTLAQVRAYYEEEPARGEVTVVIAPSPAPGPEAGGVDDEARALARTLLGAGSSASRAARDLARHTGLSRNAAYALVQEVLTETSTESGHA
jgi:16S rRNA (cytidine1402-2'-O)-methyltransferase